VVERAATKPKKKSKKKATPSAKTPARAAAPPPAPKARARTPGPPSPLAPAAAQAALALETKAIRRLQKDVARNGWQIGRRLAQVVAMELHTAGGFDTVAAYAEEVLGIARSTAFRYMRVAQTFSETAAATFGIDRLDGGLAYIAKTPEDETPSDLPTLAIRVPRDDGTVEERPFAEVTVRELGRATAREAQRTGRARKKEASLLTHAPQLAEANRALDAAVGPADAARAEVNLRDDAGDVLVDIRGVPRVRAGEALRAVAKAFD
jgi:hypothetical protein